MSHAKVVKPRGPFKPECNSFWQSLRTLVLILFFSLVNSWSILSADNLPMPMDADWGPTTYGFGGAAAAIVANHDAFLTNPAGLFYYTGYASLGGNYENMPDDRTHWTTSVVDGSHDLIGGFQFASTEVGELTRQNYTIGSAYKTPYGSLGVSIHAIRFRGVSGAGKGWHFTNSVGTIVPMGEMLVLGVYSKSPYDLEKDLALPPSVHMGLMYSRPGALRATFESGRRFKVPDEDWYYAAAGDFLFQEYLAIRGGYRWEHRSETSFWSMGGSIIGPKIELAGVYVRREGSNGYGLDLTLKF